MTFLTLAFQFPLFFRLLPHVRVTICASSGIVLESILELNKVVYECLLRLALSVQRFHPCNKCRIEQCVLYDKYFLDNISDSTRREPFEILATNHNSNTKAA